MNIALKLSNLCFNLLESAFSSESMQSLCRLLMKGGMDQVETRVLDMESVRGGMNVLCWRAISSEGDVDLILLVVKRNAWGS